MVWTLLVFWAGVYGGGTIPAVSPCQVSPRVIAVGAFYDGADVRVEGIAAPKSQVIVTVTGPARAEQFSRKARFGPVWLSAGKVRTSGAPSLFLRFASGPVSSLGVPGFDEAALVARIQLSPPPQGPAAAAALRKDYVALKKGDGVYAFHDDGVVLGASGENGKPYRAAFRWPKKAPPAEYTVHVYQVQDGKVVQETESPISVERLGFPAWLAGLAEHRAPAYGATAIVAGVMGGFGIDFLVTSLFRKKRMIVH